MKSKDSKQEYLTQCDAIVNSVEQLINKQSSILDNKTSTVESLKITHQALVNKQRDYFKAVKDFQEECTKNELLTTRLAQITAGV